VSQTESWIHAKTVSGIRCDCFQRPSPTAANTTGIFSDVQVSKYTGDISGMEFFIGLNWVLFQDAEGSAPQPVLVDAKQQGNRLSFDLPSDYPFLKHFDGEIRNDRLIGHFTRDGAEPVPIDVKRRNSFWQ
jgi:hypothetical protein